MDARAIIRNYIKEAINKQLQDYTVVYRGQPTGSITDSPNNYIWVTEDKGFAKEYGEIKAYKMPKSLEILDTDLFDYWEELIDEFDKNHADYDDYKYEPTNEFIEFLKSKGFDGFQNNRNILIFDKNNIQPI